MFVLLRNVSEYGNREGVRTLLCGFGMYCQASVKVDETRWARLSMHGHHHHHSRMRNEDNSGDELPQSFRIDGETHRTVHFPEDFVPAKFYR